MDDSLFPYKAWDGKELKADPFATLNDLTIALNGQIADLVEKCKSPNPVHQAQGMKQIALAARQVFKLPELNGMNGEGASDQYAWDLFWAFNDWQEKKNLKAASPPTSSPPADSSPISLHDLAAL